MDSVRSHVLDGDGARDVIAQWCLHYLGFELPAAPYGYADLKRDYHDDGDPWGSCMGAWHCIAAELYTRDDAIIPDSWEYRSGSTDPRKPDQDNHLLSDPFAETCALASNDALIRFGNVLQRYSHMLRAKGKDY